MIFIICGIVSGLTAVGTYIGCDCYDRAMDGAKMRSLVDGTDDTLLVECLLNRQKATHGSLELEPKVDEVLEFQEPNRVLSIMECAENDLMANEDTRRYLLLLDEVVDRQLQVMAPIRPLGGELAVQQQEKTAVEVFSIIDTPIELTNHRRVRKGRMGAAKKAALYSAKARFGTCKYTAANRKAVHRYVYNVLNKHGVQESQMCEMIPFVVDAVFVPNKYELESSRMANSWWVTFRNWSMARGYTTG